MEIEEQSDPVIAGTLAARKMPSGKWNYTVRVGKRVYSIGYCAHHPFGQHASEEEAEACYQRYLKIEVRGK